MSLETLERLESSLWEAADNLRANSKLTSSEYCMPVLGVIFLRHATNRYDAALRAIQADQAAGKMPKRALREADFRARRALMLPEAARYGVILAQPKGSNFGEALVKAMDAVEAQFAPLAGQLTHTRMAGCKVPIAFGSVPSPTASRRNFSPSCFVKRGTSSGC